MGGMAVVLAIILVIVRNYLRVEAEYKVRITNDGNQLTVRWGAKLLDVLSEAGYGIMSTCGGGGTCGTCRVKIVEGIDEPTTAQVGPLKENLRKEGWVLACQTSVYNDLVIELFEPLVQSWPERCNLKKQEETKQGASCSACGVCRACGQ